MIADWWEHWTQEQRQHEERNAAISVVSSLSTANRHAIEHLQQSFALDKITSQILEMCSKLVPQADMIELWIEGPVGTLVRQGAGPVSHPRTVPLADPPGAQKRNAFQYCLTNSCPLQEGVAAWSAFAPPGRQYKSFTIAPVIAPRTRGVLFLATLSDTPWPGWILGPATSLADQIALYYAFQTQFVGLKTVQARLEQAVREQAQLFLDFQHQLRSPINSGRNSLEALQAYEPKTAQWNAVFDALSASTRRAGTVANNLQVFISLAQGKRMTATVEKLSTEMILRRIEQASRFLYNKRALNKSIEFDVRKEHRIPLPLFEGDANLIDLAVDNLLDNAVKYSFDNSWVIIEAGAALYGREVFFSFRNHGLPVSADEIPRFLERGNRGEYARVTSPEGTGIGLWMVDQIMQAMNGRLEIKPTDERGWNESRICFRGCGL
jgi:signal transduction histidine kinase